EKLARRVAEAYHTQTDQHRIQLDFPESLPPVWGDEERLRQVLTNLVSNAIKYSPDGGVIRIGGWRHAGVAPHEEGEAPFRTPSDNVVIYVADQGIGIPSSELPHIFDRYYRVDSSLRRSTAGAGIGLFLVRYIVEAHGGRIWASSAPGRGTTFFFTVPVERTESA
ncbi:MAG: hypothetical protein IPK16_22265, partial [Anaerolineales bacterium]|nr:hypothetical protein [Anaerolineales bacterium]